MSYVRAFLVVLVLIVLAAAALWGPVYFGREKLKAREHYGPPPGMQRAESHYELGYRGWPEADWVYHANTASAISHMIERSA
jgi:hypothetical protein